MKKTCFFTLVIFLIFSYNPLRVGANTYTPLKNPPDSIAAAVSEANNYLGIQYFESTNVESKPLNYNIWSQRRLLVYSSPFGDIKNDQFRYLGKTFENDDFTNILFPHDKWKGGYLEDRDWKQVPWENIRIRNKYHLVPNGFNYNPDLLPSIYYGLKSFYGASFRGDPKPWHEYVHVLQPPTYYSWGMGRMFHEDSGKNLWYITVPLAPASLYQKWLPNLYVENLNPGTPTEEDAAGTTTYLAEAGRTYTAEVTFGVNTRDIDFDLSQFPIFIKTVQQRKQSATAARMDYSQGNGELDSMKPWWFFALFNVTEQYVKFNEKNSTITATFQWTATGDTEFLEAAINYPPAFGLYFEGTDGKQYADNVIKIPLRVQVPPDVYVKEVKAEPSLTEPGKIYRAHVTYGLNSAFTEPVQAKLGLTHNNFKVTSVDSKVIELEPGEEKTLDFTFTGMPAGINSVLEAKIWPLEPTDTDANWSNNHQSITVPSRKSDIAVLDLQQTSPVKVGTNQLASVTFKNLGTQSETFWAHYYAGNTLVKSERINLLKGGSIIKSFNWHTPNSPGSVQLKVIADPQPYQLQDLDRTNNLLTKTVQIQAEGLPPINCTAESRQEQASWQEIYWIITDIEVDENGEESYSWAPVSVTYHESLSVSLDLNTKQGTPTDPQHPLPSDRESRGSWEIIPWAEQQKLDPNQVTRAGYGFEVQVKTVYHTDYETKVPSGLMGTAAPKGGILKGPTSVKAEFFDTLNRSVGIIDLVPIEGARGDAQITWALPETSHTFSDGSKVSERKHYVDPETPDGEYFVVIHMNNVGKNGLRTCSEDFVTIYGDMYDDMYTRPEA